MPPPELFRTRIVSRDPRYPSIITICNYSLAGIFLGMFLTLSGVMLTAFNEDEESQPEQGPQQEKHKYSHAFGFILLVSGCVLILFAVASFLVASLMYLKTTTSPPTESGETGDTTWSYLDNMPEKSRSTHNQQPPPAETN